jgi:hypothetical protein
VALKLILSLKVGGPATRGARIQEPGGSRRLGETANGRTGEARIRAAGAMSLRRFMRPGERIGLARCRASPVRPFAVSPTRRFGDPPTRRYAPAPRDSWILAPFRMGGSSPLASRQPKLFLRSAQVFHDQLRDVENGRSAGLAGAFTAAKHRLTKWATCCHDFCSG